MLKNFKLALSVLVIVTTSMNVVAQDTHKDVVLDGKPAKLNVKTGEVKLVNLKTINGKNVIADTTKAKTVIQSNLITNSTNKKSDNAKAIATNRPDTLSKSHLKVIDTTDQVKTTRILVTSENTVDENSPKVETAISEKAEKATALVYDTSSSPIEGDHNTDYHKVVKGETLYALSKRYNTTLAELKRANNLETTLIKVGQYLHVKNFNKSYTSDTWVVSKGDTLYGIAKRNNTTVAIIKALNGLSSNLIRPGQKLRLK